MLFRLLIYSWARNNMQTRGPAGARDSSFVWAFVLKSPLSLGPHVRLHFTP